LDGEDQKWVLVGKDDIWAKDKKFGRGQELDFVDDQGMPEQELNALDEWIAFKEIDPVRINKDWTKSKYFKDFNSNRESWWMGTTIAWCK